MSLLRYITTEINQNSTPLFRLCSTSDVVDKYYKFLLLEIIIYKFRMCDAPEDLNYDCNYNMFLIKTQMSNLQPDDKLKVIHWMRKLASCNHNIDEMRLRNDFMYYLVINVQRGKLKAPFTGQPPNGSLTNVEKVMSGTDAQEWKAELNRAKGQRPFMDQNSTDDGSFLTARPSPRCGAFCYLAVLCNTKQ